MPEPRTEAKLPRALHLALFAVGLLWLLSARMGADSAAQGIAGVLHLEGMRGLLYQGFLLVLLATGFTALNWLGARNAGIRSTNALPWRATAPREWQKGAALGWALILITVVPMAVTGALHPQFWFGVRAWGLALLSLVTVLLGSLATEIAFRGFLFRRLIAATGPATATVLMAGVFAFLATPTRNATPYSFVVSLAAGFLFCLAYLRTHALWLGWGLRFGWLASMGVVFGLPLAGSADFAGLVVTQTSGRLGWTGGAYGPEGALFTAFVLLAGMVAVYELTRDYAWQYTHAAIVPGGYPMDVAPPAAHVAMAAVSAPPPLVQILETTSTSPSMLPVISGHLQEPCGYSPAEIQTSGTIAGLHQGEPATLIEPPDSAPLFLEALSEERLLPDEGGEVRSRVGEPGLRDSADEPRN